MSGLGECCCHFGAVLFYVDFAVNLRDSKTCTEEKAYWLLPGYKQVEYKPVADTDFTSAITLQQNIKKQAAKSSAHENNPLSRKTTRKPTHDEISAFYEKLSKCGTKPAILSIVPGYTKSFEPSLLKSSYPKSLKDLHKIEHVTLNYKELIDICNNADISITFEQLINVEKATRLQANCNKWYHFRTGRVTASVVGGVCHSTIEKPSISLIKQICYPKKFYSPATEWGCKNEKTAKELYLSLIQEEPFLGATPDALIHCDCCGDGCLEIKCPFTGREKIIFELLGDDSFLLDENVITKLNVNDNYYYQIQCQLFVTKKSYCDFFVWTTKDWHLERISIDMEFCNEMIAQSRKFFKL